MSTQHKANHTIDKSYDMYSQFILEQWHGCGLQGSFCARPKSLPQSSSSMWGQREWEGPAGWDWGARVSSHKYLLLGGCLHAPHHFPWWIQDPCCGEKVYKKKKSLPQVLLCFPLLKRNQHREVSKHQSQFYSSNLWGEGMDQTAKGQPPLHWQNTKVTSA